MSNVKLMDSNKNVIDFKSIKFSGGEIHVNVGDVKEDYLLIKSDMRTSDEIMEVLILHDALKNNGCNYVQLWMTYLPYARQDRVCTKGDAFSLRVLTGMINSSDFHSVKVSDCHSKIGLEMITGNTEDYSQLKCLIDSEFKFKDSSVIVAPDKGALEKSLAIADHFNLPCVTAEKIRDPNTGNLSGFKLNASSSDIKGKSVYVFDDICDGGGTFLGLGNLIKELKPLSMSLIVTNGIFSNDNNKVKLNEMFNVSSEFSWD